MPKERITALVTLYLRQNPEEFAIFHDGIRAFRKTMSDEVYGTVQDTNRALGGRVVERALFQVPETLSTMFIMGLSEEEMGWFKSLEGGRWFARTFPQFALAAKI